MITSIRRQECVRTHTCMHEATSPETAGVCDICVAIEKVNNRVIPKAECHTWASDSKAQHFPAKIVLI